MTTPAGLAEQAQEFGQEMTELLLATLPGLPVPPIEILQAGDRVIIRSPSPDLLPLYARRQRIAGMRVSVACQMDTTGQYLAVEESTYDLFAEVDRAPLLRIHYRRYQQSEPAAHIHVHGHRGAPSHLLSQTGHESPHEMASLHVPVGGARFRPCLEDFIQFLVCECLLDAEAGWRAHVDAGRERWRLRQAAVVARDAPEVAARVLRGLGYTVEAPDPIPAAQAKALRNW
jgi:hypothetical protein